MTAKTERSAGSRGANLGDGTFSALQFAVVCAMAIVSSSLAFAAYAEGFASGITAVILGVGGFVFLVSMHGLMRQYKRTLELSPRMETVEKSLGALQSEMGQLGELSEKVQRVEALAEQVADLQLRLSDVSGSSRYGDDRRNDAGVLQEMAGLEQEVQGIKADLEQVNHGQNQRLDAELQVLQTLISQIAEQHGSTLTDTPDNSVLAATETTQQDFLSQLRPGIDADRTGGPVFRTMRKSQQVASSAAETNSTQERGAEIQEQFDKVLGKPDEETIEQALEFAGDIVRESQNADAGPGPDMVEVVRESIEDNRVELFLQPIVGLPGENVCFYEALSRLRDPAGGLVMPDSYIDLAEESGMMPYIDNIMLFRTVQVIRRLTDRESPRGVFCNISPYSVLDPEFFPEFITFMGENRELAHHLVFEFGQPMIKNAGERALQSLAALGELGFQFSLDQVTDLNIDFNALAVQGFRFIKLDVRIFLHGMAGAGARIHAADMVSYLRRYGLELIVEKVEEERSALSIEEYDVSLGQGYYFSEPRPVRPDVFSAAA